MGISAIGTRKNVSVIDTTEYEGESRNIRI